MTALGDARRAYLDQPANFGPDSHRVRVAEADAFTAGWEAATAHVQAAARSVMRAQRAAEDQQDEVNTLQQAAVNESTGRQRYALIESTLTVIDAWYPRTHARFQNLSAARAGLDYLQRGTMPRASFNWTAR